jgi:RNA polymerase subunit RPABC4/transcription elongation factor Spt4
MSGHAAAFVITLFLTIGLACAVAIHAINRDRSGLFWGLLTVFTGILGAIAYALVAVTAAAEDADPDEVRLCPACGTRHLDTPEYCSDCGADLDASNDVPTATILQSGPERYCGNCHAALEDDVDRCTACDAVL